jgi:hypothetical protein
MFTIKIKRKALRKLANLAKFFNLKIKDGNKVRLSPSFLAFMFYTIGFQSTQNDF